MRESWALIRASWLSAASYRMAMATSLAGLAFIIVPLYFVSNALQATMQQTIATEAREYFGFVVMGAICFTLASSCLGALPSAIDGAMGRGTLEVILGTPARLAAVCTGLMGYGVLWTILRAAIVLGVATWLGVNIVWRGAPLGLVVLAITMLSYAGLGLILAAMVLLFRTTGPLTTAVMTGSMLLGGVYYPTSVIPSWLRDVTTLFPLTYGLRALRQIVLRGDSFAQVARDVQILSAITAVLLIVGAGAFSMALQRARRTGTLASY